MERKVYALIGTVLSFTLGIRFLAFKEEKQDTLTICKE